MCSVWVCVPSKRPVEVVAEWAAAWRKQGYKIALLRDDMGDRIDGVDLILDPCEFNWDGYPGYAVAVNSLAKWILRDEDQECNWIVTGGDDVFPDPNHTASEIARECEEHFRNLHIERTGETIEVHPTFGCMQPTGDRWPSEANCYVDRVCGSPWLGREFCLRMYGGRGPLYHEYTHNFVDEELQAVALKYGVLWQRRDLIHRHENWARARQDARDMPDFLRNVTGSSPEAQAHWRKYKLLFESRKAAGFPGSEPL